MLTGSATCVVPELEPGKQTIKPCSASSMDIANGIGKETREDEEDKKESDQARSRWSRILAEVVDFMEDQTKSGPPDLPAGETKMPLQCLNFG
ncbi:hypothetical protein GBF38_007387 [Nibea albiflora]|uniref:Uncharacterized protein n=1 Tax=Nibea albiflora TaxID=240163 RepID=A0ACB7EIA1_NIBAL|nr:hypothetical protein GBF38_007387 [Nibea albiflora]